MKEQLLMTVAGTMIVIDPPDELYTFTQLRKMLKLEAEAPLHFLPIDNGMIMVMRMGSGVGSNDRATTLAHSKFLIGQDEYILGDVLIIYEENLGE